MQRSFLTEGQNVLTKVLALMLLIFTLSLPAVALADITEELPLVEENLANAEDSSFALEEINEKLASIQYSLLPEEISLQADEVNLSFAPGCNVSNSAPVFDSYIINLAREIKLNTLFCDYLLVSPQPDEYLLVIGNFSDGVFNHSTIYDIAGNRFSVFYDQTIEFYQSSDFIFYSNILGGVPLNDSDQEILFFVVLGFLCVGLYSVCRCAFGWLHI